MLHNLVPWKAVLTLAAVMSVAGAYIYCEVIPARDRITYETAVSSVLNCNKSSCLVKFEDFFSETMVVATPVSVGDTYRLSYEEEYNRRTGVLRHSKLLSVEKVLSD